MPLSPSRTTSLSACSRLLLLPSCRSRASSPLGSRLSRQLRRLSLRKVVRWQWSTMRLRPPLAKKAALPSSCPCCAARTIRCVTSRGLSSIWLMLTQRASGLAKARSSAQGRRAQGARRSSEAEAAYPRSNQQWRLRCDPCGGAAGPSSCRIDV